MKTKIMSFPAFVALKRSPATAPESAEFDLTRTAFRNCGDDNLIQEWTSRAAMLKTCDMQSRRAPRQTDWKPFQP